MFPTTLFASNQGLTGLVESVSLLELKNYK
jgi:hypothetical protein